MHKVNCLIVDDEPIAQRIIANYLADLPDFVIEDTCLHAIEALSVLESKNIDLMFLDIEMPKLKGLSFLKTLKSPPHVIITTAHREYALEGFDLEVVDYLLKPISFERFIKAINRFKKIYELKDSSSINKPKISADIIYVKSDRKTIKLSQSNIEYIESMNNYIIFHVADHRYIVYSSMTEMLNQLNSSFIKIHKSYVVNKEKVTAFTKEQVTLGQIELPIGKAYKAIMEKL